MRTMTTLKVVAKYNPDMYKGLMQNLQAEAATGNTPALVQIGWAFLDYFFQQLFLHLPTGDHRPV